MFEELLQNHQKQYFIQWSFITFKSTEKPTKLKFIPEYFEDLFERYTLKSLF